MFGELTNAFRNFNATCRKYQRELEKTRAMGLTKRHKEELARIAEGWRPFPFQLSGLEKALLRDGLVKTVLDERCNIVLEITEAGRAVNEGKSR
jgi:hypothetical protein